MKSSLSRLQLASALLVMVALVVSGCSGMLLLARYIGAASTIYSLFDDDGDPGYQLLGFVYIDRTDNRIAISGDMTPPASPGDWESYSGTTVIIDTTPPRTDTTDQIGYFSFSGIPDSRLILTVEAPDGMLVRFNVRLNAHTIEPAAGL